MIQVGIGDNASKRPAPHLAVVAAANNLPGPIVLWEERQHVADHEQPIGVFCRGDHPLAIGEPQRHGLFAKHVLSGFQRTNGNIGMQECGQRDVDKLDLGVAQQVVEIGVRIDSRKIDLLAWRPEVALDIAPIAGESLGNAFTDGDHLYSAKAVVREPMNPANETNANNANANHRGASSGIRVARSISTSVRGRPSPRSWNNNANRTITTTAIAAGTSQMLCQSCGIAASGVA